MSKLYSRPRTPPTPPSLSQKSSSSRSSRHDLKGYDEPSKPYSRDYEKYSSYDKYDKYERPKYEKSDKFDCYDKMDKSGYKSSSYLPNKEYNQDYSSSVLKGTSSHSDKYIGKSNSSYQEEPYRSKGNLYSDQSYSDRDSYLSKYPSRNSDKYSKYSPSDGKDISDSKYSSHSVRMGLSNSSGGDKKYAPYPTNKSMPYSKYGSESNSYYPKNESSYDSYDSYNRGSNQGHAGRGKGGGVGGGGGGGGGVRGYSEVSMRTGAGKSYSNNDSHDSYGGGYQSSLDRNTFGASSHSSKIYNHFDSKKRSPERKYLDRYVIGDSVVYGSPGHYPKDIYPPSPKSKRARSPHSPPPLLTSSKIGNSSGKSYSRYSSSPKRYSSSSSKAISSRDEASYSRSSNRKPPSPPVHSYQGMSSQSHSRSDRTSRNYTPPPDRGKGYDDRYEFGKSGRYYDQRGSSLHDQGLKSHGDDSSRNYGAYRRKEDTYLKPYSSYQDSSLRGNTSDLHSRNKYPPERPLKPLMAPKPLLSIPLSVNSLPKESRANLRETLGLPRNRPLNGLEKGGKARRLEGRIGSRKKPSQSPKDKKKRRPDDLRLWIESRKTEGGKTNGASAATKGKGQTKRPPRGGEGANRSRLLESRRRILNKGKKKGGVLRRGMKKPRRPLPPKPKSRDEEGKSRDGLSKKNDSSNVNESRSRDEGSKKRRERKEGGECDRDRGSETNRGSGSTSGKGPGSNANTRRPIKRPRVISQANRLPLKSRPVKRSSHRSSLDREKSSSKSEKNHHYSTKSKGKDRSRSRSRTRSPSRSRPRSRLRSRSRSPRRSEKDEPSSSSRH